MVPNFKKCYVESLLKGTVELAWLIKSTLVIRLEVRARNISCITIENKKTLKAEAVKNGLPIPQITFFGCDAIGK